LPETKDWKVIGTELGGFGHDDRSCVWAALNSGLETLVNNDNTTMIFALDNEEIGSVGNSASYRGFFENVVRETLKIVYKEKSRDMELPAALNRHLLGGMPAIFADVGVGLGPEELQDPSNVDHSRASRPGWGVMINSGMTISPKHTDRYISLLQKYLPGKKRQLRYQIGGDYLPVDSRAWAASAQMHDSFGDVMPCMNVGIAVAGLHHPRMETINIFDLHWMKEAYKIYLKN
jgi:aspartyl aminopeptidase